MDYFDYFSGRPMKIFKDGVVLIHVVSMCGSAIAVSRPRKSRVVTGIAEECRGRCDRRRRQDCRQHPQRRGGHGWRIGSEQPEDHRQRAEEPGEAKGGRQRSD